MTALAAKAGDMATELHERTRRSGALRDDVSAADVVLLLEMIMTVQVPGPDDGAALRRRYLALLVQALRAPAADRLPGPAAEESDLVARWRVRTSSR